jgi:hypothetical protein
MHLLYLTCLSYVKDGGHGELLRVQDMPGEEGHDAPTLTDAMEWKVSRLFPLSVSVQFSFSLEMSRFINELFLRFGFHKMVFQSNCVSLIRKLNAKHRDRSPVGAIVADIKSLSNLFTSTVFIYISR